MGTQRGFSLIELMIGVAITALVAGVGIPAYQNVVRKVALSDVNQAFANISSRQAQYYLDARKFGGSLMNASLAGGIALEKDLAQRGYVCADDNAEDPTGTVCQGKHFTIYFAAAPERIVFSGWAAVAVPTSTGAFKGENFWYLRAPRSKTAVAVLPRAQTPIEAIRTDETDPSNWDATQPPQ